MREQMISSVVPWSGQNTSKEVRKMGGEKAPV
jgi:hypothetical protein